MASDTELNIILRLKDELSKGMSQAQAKVTDWANKVQEAGEKLEKVGRDISRFGGDLSQIGGMVTAGFTAALIKASEHSIELRDGFRSLKESGQALADIVGNALAPVFTKVVGSVNGLVGYFKTLNPELRDQVIRWAAIGGALMTAAGSVLWLSGKFLDLAGNLIQVSAVAAKFLAANPIILAITGIVGAVVLLIGYWDQLRGYVMRVVDVFSVALSSINVAYRSVMAGLQTLMISFVSKLKSMVALAMDAYDKIGMEIPIGLERARVALNNFERNSKATLEAYSDTTAEIMTENGEIWDGAHSDMAKNVDEAMMKCKGYVVDFGKSVENTLKNIPPAAKTNFQKFSDGVAEGFKAAKDKILDFEATGKEVATNLSNAFNTALSDSIYDAFQGESTKDALKNFGDTCLKIVADLIAQMLIAKGIDMFSGTDKKKINVGDVAANSAANSSGDSWWSSLFGGGAGGSSSGGMGGMGIFAAVVAGIVAQEAATRDTDREFDGVQTGNAFDGQFATEPWFAWMNQEMGVAGATAGESFDAAIKNHDWGKAFRTSFNALDYWFDPMSNWLDSLFKGIIGEEAYEKYNLQTFIDPISQIFDLFTDFEGTLESLIDPFGSVQESIEETNDVLDKVGLGIHDWKDALKLVDPVMFGVVDKFGDMKDVLGGVAASMFPLESIMYKVTDGFSNMGSVLQWLDPITYGLVNGFGKFGDALSDLWGSIKDLLGQIPGTGFGGGGGFDIGDVFDPIGIFQTGTRYVPETGYAMVHKGEEITRANEVEQRAQGGNITINLNISAIDGASVQKIFPQIANELVKTLKRNGALRGAILNV